MIDAAPDRLVHSLASESMSALLQRAGFRVQVAPEADGSVLLHSSTGGMAFHVRLSDPRTAETANYLVATFLAVVRVQGELPLGVVNLWNASKRYGRMHLTGDALVLEMDAPVIGGISEAHLFALVQIWDRLIQDLVPFLREAAAGLATKQAAADMPARPDVARAAPL